MSVPKSKTVPATPFARVSEAKEFLGVSDCAIRAAVERGELAAFRLDKTIRIWWSSLYAVSGDECPRIEWPTGVATAEQAAEWCQVSPGQMRHRMSNGELPSYRLGRSHRIRWEALKAFVEQQRTAEFRDQIQAGSESASESEASNG